MAPEQAAGDPSLVDARADVFAIGAILRDLCGANSPSSHSDAAGDISRRLRAIIGRAMAPHPPDRYADVTAVARDLAAFRAGDRVSAYEENLFERVRRLAVRHSTPILLVLAYLLMRVTFLAVFGR